MTVKNYDPAKSYELAEHFLQDERPKVSSVPGDPVRALDDAARVFRRTAICLRATSRTRSKTGSSCVNTGLIK